jgi:TonB family protein
MKSRIAALFVLFSTLILVPNAPAQESSGGVRKVAARVTPQYPNVARRMNLQGSVKLEVLVAPNGTVKSLEVKGGHPMLADAAQNALRQWKWEPAPHETHETIEIKFQPQASAP